ncbi:hypothetical protein Hanom_Chr04g00359941 [Helianthus anomalus]
MNPRCINPRCINPYVFFNFLHIDSVVNRFINHYLFVHNELAVNRIVKRYFKQNLGVFVSMFLIQGPIFYRFALNIVSKHMNIFLSFFSVTIFMFLILFLVLGLFDVHYDLRISE